MEPVTKVPVGVLVIVMGIDAEGEVPFADDVLEENCTVGPTAPARLAITTKMATIREMRRVIARINVPVEHVRGVPISGGVGGFLKIPPSEDQDSPRSAA